MPALGVRRLESPSIDSQSSSAASTPQSEERRFSPSALVRSPYSVSGGSHGSAGTIRESMPYTAFQANARTIQDTLVPLTAVATTHPNDRHFIAHAAGNRHASVGNTVSPTRGHNYDALEACLLKVYSSESSRKLDKHEQDFVARSVKQHILPRIKFVPSFVKKKADAPDIPFPSFWKPNIINNDPPFISAFFNQYGARFASRTSDSTILQNAAELWKAAAPFIKKLVDHHRASVAQRMKCDIVTGLCYIHQRPDIDDAPGDAEFFKKHPQFNVRILKGLKVLVESYVNDPDPQKMAKVRIENMDAFEAFCVLCLKHTNGAMVWKLKHRKCSIKSMYSVSDEALAFLILDNSCEIWERKARGEEVLADGKYMTRAAGGRANFRRAWSNRGKERYNKLFAQVSELRSFTLSTTVEGELMNRWKQESRTNSRRNGDCVSDDDDISDDEEREVITMVE